MRVALLVLIASLATILFSCRESLQTPVRIGTNVWPGYEPLYLGRDLGMFPESSFRMVEYQNSSEVGRAFRNQAIDVAALTLDEVLYAAADGMDPVVIAVTDISIGADAILAQPGIKSLADLKGKRVGLEIGSIQSLLVARALELSNMELKSIVPIMIPADHQVGALQSGQVDAVAVFEPGRSELVSQGFKELFNSAQIPGEIVDVLVTRRDFLAAHPDEIALLRAMWFTSLDRFLADTTKTLRLIVQREHATPQVAAQVLAGIHFPRPQEDSLLLRTSSPSLLLTAKRIDAALCSAGILSKPLPTEKLFTPLPLSTQ